MVGFDVGIWHVKSFRCGGCDERFLKGERVKVEEEQIPSGMDAREDNGLCRGSVPANTEFYSESVKD